MGHRSTALKICYLHSCSMEDLVSVFPLGSSLSTFDGSAHNTVRAVQPIRSCGGLALASHQKPTPPSTRCKSLWGKIDWKIAYWLPSRAKQTPLWKFNLIYRQLKTDNEEVKNRDKSFPLLLPPHTFLWFQYGFSACCWGISLWSPEHCLPLLQWPWCLHCCFLLFSFPTLLCLFSIFLYTCKYCFTEVPLAWLLSSAMSCSASSVEPAGSVVLLSSLFLEMLPQFQPCYWHHDTYTKLKSLPRINHKTERENGGQMSFTSAPSETRNVCYKVIACKLSTTLNIWKPYRCFSLQCSGKNRSGLNSSRPGKFSVGHKLLQEYSSKSHSILDIFWGEKEEGSKQQLITGCL